MPKPDTRKLAKALLAAISCIILVASGEVKATSPETTGVTDTEITIGSCSALSGPAEFLGTQQIMGARAYLNYINDQGGIQGRKFKLVYHDDQYEPKNAVACFSKLLSENIFAAAFFVGTPTAAKYLPMAEAKGVPIVGLFTGAEILHTPFHKLIFSIRASYFDETRTQIDGLWEAGIRKFAVIYQEDAFGAAVLDGVKKALLAHKSSPIVLGSFPRNTIAVDSAIAEVRKQNPEVVILVGAYGPEAEIVRRSHKQGFSPLFTTVSFVGTDALIRAAGKDANGMIVTEVVPLFTHTEYPTVALYTKQLKKYFPDAHCNFTSLEGFIDAMVLCEGVKRAGKNLTRPTFISALESIHDWDCGLGTCRITFGPQRHKGLDQVYPLQIRDGKGVAFKDWKDTLKH